MNIKSHFILPPNTSRCQGGMCSGDPACRDQHCEGKNAEPVGYEAALPPSFTADPPQEREPVDWLLWIENGVAVVFFAFLGGGFVWCAFNVTAYFLAAILGRWPVLVAALSF